MKLGAEHLQRYEEDGYLVIENWFPEATRVAILDAMKQWVPPRPIPENAFVGDSFPYEIQLFNEVIMDPDLLEFIALALDSEDLHLRLAHNWVRFPGNDPLPIEKETEVLKYSGGTTKQRFGGFHIDNGNNSLVPPTHDRRLGQISTWYFPDAVDESQAPMLVVPKGHGNDRSKAIALTVPAGTLMIFNTVLWHSSSMFQGTEGQRYTLTRIFGRADHPWEGVGSFTNVGSNMHWRQFISGLNARERQYFRFPPPGHELYTAETLEVLEEHYPGWNALGEYSPVESPDSEKFLTPRYSALPRPGPLPKL